MPTDGYRDWTGYGEWTGWKDNEDNNASRCQTVRQLSCSRLNAIAFCRLIDWWTKNFGRTAPTGSTLSSSKCSSRMFRFTSDSLSSEYSDGQAASLANSIVRRRTGESADYRTRRCVYRMECTAVWLGKHTLSLSLRNLDWNAGKQLVSGWTIGKRLNCWKDVRVDEWVSEFGRCSVQVALKRFKLNTVWQQFAWNQF